MQCEVVIKFGLGNNRYRAALISQICENVRLSVILDNFNHLATSYQKLRLLPWGSQKMGAGEAAPHALASYA